MPATPGSVYGAENIGTSTIDSGASLASPARLVFGKSDHLLASDSMTSTPRDDDDASDISMSAETEDSDDDFEYGTPGAASRIISQSATNEAPATGQKRKMSLGVGTGRGEDQKRVKIDLSADPALTTYRNKEGRLPVDRSLLPAEIWHQIFTFTSPKTLGRLLRVKKVFRAYLDTSSASPLSLASLSMSVSQMRTPEAIWRSSRILFYPGMPSPLRGLNERDMWKLACGKTCKFCDRKSQPASPRSKDQWHSGPGEDGVSTIWPFAIRSCGSCLLEESIKEIDLLLSSSVPTLLMAALPSVFVTDDLHVISATMLQNESTPANVHMVKYFLKAHTEDIKTEFFKVKNMGSGTAEEWLKGLDEKGRERRSDASRWDRWELLGGVQRMQETDFPEIERLPRRTKVVAPTASTISINNTKQSVLTNEPKVQAGGGSTVRSSGVPMHTDQSTSASICETIHTPPRFDSPAQNGFAPYTARTFQQQRHERTKEEVAELKAARRAEIERRCMLLKPPLTPAVLSYMGSFQAAIQIIKPLDDSAWEVLKPRLLSQSEEAQQREIDVAQTRVVQEKYDERRQLDVYMKEVKEVNDREWDDIQAPLRARIGGFAEETIRDGWHGGEKVTKESSPSFAAEVLIYVRKRFYAEVAKDEAAARAAGREPKVDPPNGPFTQKLVLENMKWVFDTKIKPLTEQYSKELFLCNGCENNFKFYGFEGVIQHYAAKHTSALSVGSIVVHWRAEWPEYPPFNPDPNAAINNFHSAAKSGNMYPNGAATSPHVQGFGGYPPVSGQAAMPTQALQQPSAYQPSPVPYYGQLHYGDQFSISQTGQFLSPLAIQGQAPPFQGAQYQATPTGGYQPYPGQGYPNGFEGSYPNGAPLTFDSPHPSQAYPVAVVDQTGQIYTQPGHFQSTGQYDVGQYITSQQNPGPRPVVTVRTEGYKAQLYIVAQAARDVWNQTAGVKDMPGSVRVYVILHHILKRSRAEYPDAPPPLAMLIDGLSNNKDMRPVRNVNGLACRACKVERTDGNTNPHKGSGKGSGANEKKLFSLPQLLNHFQTVHIEGPESPDLDWTEDMVDLPDISRISVLAHAQGMDDNKLQLVSEALPEAFSASPPQTDRRKPGTAYTVYNQDEDESKYGNLAPSRDEHQKYYASEPQGRYQEPNKDQFDRSDESLDKLGQNTPILVTSVRQRHFDDRSILSRDPGPMTYIERRQASPITSVRAVDEYGRHVIREESRFYADPSSHYRDPDPGYKKRRLQASEVIPYDEPGARIEHGYAREVSLPRLLEMTDRLASTTMISRGDQVTHVKSEHKPRSNPSRPVSHSSLRTRNHQTPRVDPIDGGSEDGELRTQTISAPQPENISYAAEGSSPAERFLNELQPEETTEEYAQMAEVERRNEDALRARWESERIEGIRRMRQPVVEQHQRGYERYEDDGRTAVISLPPTNKNRSPEPLNGRPRPERHVQQHQIGVPDYDDRYAQTNTESTLIRPHSHEIDEHRHRLDDVLYRDDREAVHGTHPTQNRFARYERLESDRARSRSPLYVKLGGLPGQYRDQSPQPRYPQQEPLYRTRTPQSSIQEVSFERIPRPEYYRVYADEPRPREIHHENAVEYVQVVDPKGDYLIRRPIRRDPEPVYTTFEDGNFAPRQAVYESRAQVSRSDPAYYEEYDPRHPAPPPSATVRQLRYQ